MELKYTVSIPYDNGYELIYDFDFSKYNTYDKTVTAKVDVYFYTPKAGQLRFVNDLGVIPSFRILTKPTSSVSYKEVFTSLSDNLQEATNYFVNTSTTYNAGKHLIGSVEETQTYMSLKELGFYSTASSTYPYIRISGMEYTHFRDSSYNNYYPLDDESIKVKIEPSKPDGMVSTATASTTYIGENTVILINRADNTFTHTITYTFGSLSGTIVEKSSATQIQWLVPGTFIYQLGSSATSGTVTLTITTYEGTKQVGIPQTSKFTVLIDASIGGPIFSPVVNDTNSTTLALTGNSKILVKYFSNASVTSGAAGQNGATIKSQYIKNGNKIVNGGTATFNNIDTPVFEFSATDSRQFTANSSYTASYVDYSKLSSNIFVSTPTVAGNVSVRIEGNYFTGTFGAVKNTLTLKYRRKTGEGDYGDWITCTPTISGSNYYIEFQLTGLDYKQTHTFQTQAVDKLMTVSSAEVTVIGKPIFDWGKEDFHISVPLHLDEELHMGNGQHITAINQNGDVINALTPCDSAGNTVLGYGNYDAETGETYIYGNKVNIIANNGVTVNGTSIAGGGAENKILWQGTSTMSASDSISLSENITKQLTGIVLVFSASNADVSVNTFFLSKKEVELMAGAPHCFFLLNNSGLATVGAKYLYINNGSITGHDTNSSTGTAASGIKFTNNNFVLRYVIGV
jgi:hypothetical protein